MAIDLLMIALNISAAFFIAWLCLKGAEQLLSPSKEPEPLFPLYACVEEITKHRTKAFNLLLEMESKGVDKQSVEYVQMFERVKIYDSSLGLIKATDDYKNA